VHAHSKYLVQFNLSIFTC